MAAVPPIVPIVPDGTNRAKLTPGTAVTITGDVGPLAYLRAFNFRNGDISAAKSLLVKATISAMWHWCPISGLPADRAISQTAAYIRVALTMVMQHKPADMSAEVARKIALILGVTRAVVTQTYNIADSDLIPGERAEPILVASVDENESVTYAARQGLSQEIKATLSVDLALTDGERAAIAAISMCAYGIPPVQGYSLAMTQHHYLSDPKSQSFRAFNVIERANWSSNAVKTWWEDNVESLRDALWHKACHPLAINLKMALAQRESVRDMLITAGCGPAASRLPAMEPELRRGHTYKTLLQTVRPMYELMGGATNYLALDEAIKMIEYYPTGATPLVPPLMKTIPPTIINRKSALTHLDSVLKANSDVVAHAFGFYKAMSERAAMMSVNARTNTLAEANSLDSLENDSPAAFREGRDFYDDYHTKKSQDRAAGKFLKVDLYLNNVGESGAEQYD